MKVLVTYLSRSGNTKKVAESIFEEISADKEIKPLNEVANLDGYDVAFVGFPIERFGPAQEAKSLLAERCAGRAIALFVTHAAPEENENVVGYLSQCREVAGNAKLVGLFNCQGELAQGLKKAMINSGDPNLKAWSEMSDVSIGQPDASRLEMARIFAREVMADSVMKAS